MEVWFEKYSKLLDYYFAHSGMCLGWFQ